MGIVDDIVNHDSDPQERGLAKKVAKPASSRKCAEGRFALLPQQLRKGPVADALPRTRMHLRTRMH
jgi:hypothetical protein